METEDEDSSFGFWNRVVIVFLALLGLDAFLALRLKIRLGDLLFVEGAIVFAAGAFAAAGVGNIRRETYGTMAGHPEGQKEFLEEQRGKQVSAGIKLMIIGAIIIALSIIYTLV